MQNVCGLALENPESNSPRLISLIAPVTVGTFDSYFARCAPLPLDVKTQSGSVRIIFSNRTEVKNSWTVPVRLHIDNAFSRIVPVPDFAFRIWTEELPPSS